MPSTSLLSVSAPTCSIPLHATEFRGSEGLSELFDFTVDLLVPIPGLESFGNLLGQSVGVTLRQADGQERAFHGLVRKVERLGQEKQWLRYRVQLAPRLWLLTKSVQTRLFQSKSVPDILRYLLQT